MSQSQFTSESPMFDSQGNRWSDEGGPETWAAPENGQPLYRLPIGTEVKVGIRGHGPYLADGSPDFDRGAKEPFEITGVYSRIDERSIDDGLYEKFAIVTVESGKDFWVPFKGFSEAMVDVNGNPDLTYYATGVEVVA